MGIRVVRQQAIRLCNFCVKGQKLCAYSVLVIIYYTAFLIQIQIITWHWRLNGISESILRTLTHGHIRCEWVEWQVWVREREGDRDTTHTHTVRKHIRSEWCNTLLYTLWINVYVLNSDNVNRKDDNISAWIDSAEYACIEQWAHTRSPRQTQYTYVYWVWLCCGCSDSFSLSSGASVYIVWRNGYAKMIINKVNCLTPHTQMLASIHFTSKQIIFLSY